MRILLFGLIAPFAAAFIERYGVKRMVLSAVALIAAMLLLALGMTSYWQLVALFGVVLGLGTGMTALVMSAIVATRWFTARRGLVIGMLTASTATGQLRVPAARGLAGEPLRLAFGAGCPRSSAWPRRARGASVHGRAPLRPRPRPLWRDRPVRAARRPPPALRSAFRVLGEVSPCVVFWVLAATFFVCGLSTNGLIQTHFISLCADYGVPSVAAASMLALIGACDFVGTIGSGWLSDRYDNRALLFVYYGLRGLSLLYLPASSFSIYALSIFAVFYGLDWVATVPPTARLSAETFGRERAGVAFGWIFASHMIGAAVRRLFRRLFANTPGRPICPPSISQA